MRLRAMFSIVRREQAIALASPLQLAIPGLLLPLVVLWLLASSLPLDAADPHVHYTAGVTVAFSMRSTAGIAMWPIITAMRWTPSFRAISATPVRPADIFGGYVAWVGLRASTLTLLYLSICAAAGLVPAARMIPSAAVVGLASIAVGGPLVAFAASRTNDTDFEIVDRLLVTPVFFFSDTLFPIDALPSVVEGVARLFPPLHAARICRALLHDEAPHLSSADLSEAAAIGSVWILLGTAAGIGTFRKQLHQ